MNTYVFIFLLYIRLFHIFFYSKVVKKLFFKLFLPLKKYFFSVVLDIPAFCSQKVRICNKRHRKYQNYLGYIFLPSLTPNRGVSTPPNDSSLWSSSLVVARRPLGVCRLRKKYVKIK